MNQKQTNDLRRLVTAARIDYREAWAVAQTVEAAARIEEAEKLLTAALAILGEEPGDEVQAWEAYPLDRNEEGKCVTPPGSLPAGMRETHCPWDVGYGCMMAEDWVSQDGPRVTCKCFAEGCVRRTECWAYLLRTWEAQ